MLLIHIGRLRLNLEYLICDEEGDGTPATAGLPPGDIRVTLERGKEFVLSGEDAARYRALVAPYVQGQAAGGEAAGPFSEQDYGHVAPRPEVARRPEELPPGTGPPEPRHARGGHAEAGGGLRP